MLMVCVPDRPRYKKKKTTLKIVTSPVQRGERGEGGVIAVRRAAPRLVLQYVGPLRLPCGTENPLPSRRLHWRREGSAGASWRRMLT